MSIQTTETSTLSLPPRLAAELAVDWSDAGRRAGLLPALGDDPPEDEEDLDDEDDEDDEDDDEDEDEEDDEEEDDEAAEEEK